MGSAAGWAGRPEKAPQAEAAPGLPGPERAPERLFSLWRSPRPPATSWPTKKDATRGRTPRIHMSPVQATKPLPLLLPSKPAQLKYTPVKSKIKSPT